MEKKIQRTSIINDKKAVSFDIMRLNNQKMNQIHGHTIDKNGKIFKIFLKRRKIGNHKNHINTDTSYKLNPKEVYSIFDESKKVNKIENNTKNIKIKITKKKTKKSPTKISKKDDAIKVVKKDISKKDDAIKVVKKVSKKDDAIKIVKKDSKKVSKKDVSKKDTIKKDTKKVVKKDKVKKSKKSVLKTLKK